MADDLDPVRQQFEAEVADYVDAVHVAADGARDFAGSAEEAKVAVDGLRDHAVEAGEALGHVRDESLEAAAANKELGDSADQAAAKLDLLGLSGVSSFSFLGPLLGIIGAIVIAAAAVAPAVASMGLGFAAFGAFALPTIMQISSGLQTISADTQAVQSATTAAARNTALAKLKNDWAGMPAPIADAVKEIIAFKNEFEQLSVTSGMQAETLSAMDTALGIARDLMKEVMPLAVQGAFAVNRMLEAIQAGIQSSGFQHFLAVMTQMVVPATMAITHLAFTILGVLGQALEQLAPLSIPFINFLSVLIQALGGPVVAALHVIISLFLGLATAIEPLLPGLSAIATTLINDIGSSFAEFIPIIQQVVAILGGTFLKILQDLLPVIANALTPNTPFMMALQELPHLLSAIMPLFTALASMMANPVLSQGAVWVISLVIAFKALQGALAIARAGFALLTAVMEVNPIILILTGIALLVVAFIYLWNHCAAFRDFWKDLWRDAIGAFDAATDAIRAGFDAVVHAAETVIDWVASHWKIILAWLVDPVAMAVFEIRTHTHDIAKAFDEARHDVAAIIDGLVHDAETGFDQIRHAIAVVADWVPHELESSWDAGYEQTRRFIGDVLGFFERLPGQILSFLASLPGEMLAAGRNIIDGLIHGIESAAADIPGIMKSLAGDVESYFTDPLKIFSPSRVFFEHGVNTVRGYIQGVQSMLPQLQALMRGAGGQVASSGAGIGTGPAGGSYGSAPVNVTVPITLGAGTQGYNDPAFQQYLQREVQEAILRYQVNNPGNGLSSAWGTR